MNDSFARDVGPKLCVSVTITCLSARIVRQNQGSKPAGSHSGPVQFCCRGYHGCQAYVAAVVDSDRAVEREIDQLDDCVWKVRWLKRMGL